MNWIIETKDDYFEGNKLKHLVNTIVEYCVDEDYYLNNITSIYVEYEDNERFLSRKLINKIEDLIEFKIEARKREDKEEIEHYKSLQFDYETSIIN